MAESLGSVVLGIQVDQRQAAAGLDAFRAKAEQTGQVSAQAIGKASQAASNLAGNLAGAIAGIGIGAAITGFVRSSIGAATELDTVTRKLTNSLGPQGAAGALSFTQGLSDRLGISFSVLSDTFSRFTAAATAANIPLEQQRNLFAAVSQAGQALGLTNDELNGTFLALQQIASKGIVSQEELRQQLGERLPLATAAAARGLGVTVQGLNRLVESGRLTAQEFFPAITRGLNELTAGSQATPTAAQNFAKLGNAWRELQTEFGTNLLPEVTRGVQLLTGAIEGIGVTVEARRLGLAGGLAGFLGAIPTEGAQAVGALRSLQQQFNLTAQQARALFTDAVAAEGGRVNAFGQLTINAEQFGRVLDSLPARAQRFRQANPDTTGALKAAEAEAARLLEIERQRAETAASRATAERDVIGPAERRLAAARQTLGLEGAALQAAQRRLAVEEAGQAVLDAQARLAAARQRPGGPGGGPAGVIAATAALEAAGANFETAVIGAVNELVQGAREAARSVKDARQGVTSARVGAFDLLNRDAQLQTRADLTGQIQTAFNRGQLDAGALFQRGIGFLGGGNTLDTSRLTIEQLSEIASQSKGLTDANDGLRKALDANSAVQKELASALAAGTAINVTVPVGAVVDSNAPQLQTTFR